MERLEHIILESFKKRAAQDVMWWEGSWLTGADLLDLVEKDRAVLEAAGFKEGQRLMTLLPNCPALEALALAVWSLKGTLIPMNMRAGVDNLLPTIDLVQPFAIVVSRGDDKAASGVRRYPVVETEVAGVLDAFRGVERKSTGPDWAVFFTTSGTTGMPKAVPLTHSNFIANVRSLPEHIDLRESDTMLWVLPNFHSFGLTLGMLLPHFMNCKVTVVGVFMPPLKVLQAIQASGADVLFFVPAMVEFLKRSAAHNTIDIKNVRLVITGGDRLNTALDQASIDLFGHPILEGYGTTECSPVISCNPSYENRKVGTIGKVLPGYEWKVVDTQGTELPPETPGVLMVRGPAVFHGYYEAPEVTAERLHADGWYDTGDVVKYDADGYLTVLDRLTDIIIVGGFNVYPQEVERILNAHPAVAQAAVVSMHHAVNGEIPRAFIVLKEGASVTDRDIIEYCKGKLANYKVPRKVDFVESLPVSANGKILRRKLREMA